MKVMVFGTFDILHAGHENFFQQAGNLGNEVIAIVSRDETTMKLKGRPPHNNENIRVKNLKKTGFCSKVVLGSLGDKYKVIQKFRPDIIALGYDQFAFTYRLEKFLIDEKMNTKIERLKPYRPEIYKSSIIRDSWLSRIKEKTLMV